MLGAVTRAWRWITGRTTLRPRRITVVIWLLLYLFSQGIARLVTRYQEPLLRSDEWLLMAMVPIGAALFTWIWWSGRGARQRRRERHG